MIEKLRELLFKIFKKESFLGKIIDKLVTKEIVTYIIFGVLTTLVNFLTYTAVIKTFGDSEVILFKIFGDSKVTLCNGIAWAVAVLFAFITNKLFVFESKSFAPAVFFNEFFAFFSTRIFTGLLEIFLPELLMKIGLDQKLFGVEGMLAKVVVAVIVVILNYVFSKLVAFRKKK